MRKQALGLFLTLCVFGAPAHATGIPVVDVANLSQNIEQTLNTLKSTLNEAKMIANQIQSLENEAKNLASLEYSIIDDFSDGMERLFEEVGKAHGLMSSLSELERRFEELYPEITGEKSSGELKEVVDHALSESRKRVLDAARTGATVMESLPRSQAELDKLLSDSGGAVGILQATQAGNQIAATVSGNLIHLNALMAGYAEAHLSQMAKVNQSEEAARNRAEQVLRGLGDSRSPKVPMNPF